MPAIEAHHVIDLMQFHSCVPMIQRGRPLQASANAKKPPLRPQPKSSSEAQDSQTGDFKPAHQFSPAPITQRGRPLLASPDAEKPSLRPLPKPSSGTQDKMQDGQAGAGSKPARQ